MENDMKSKNKIFKCLCLLVALVNIQPSYAEEKEPDSSVTQQTDIKSGDEITITEVEPEQSTKAPAPITVEEQKPQKPAGKKPVEKQTENVETKTPTTPTVDPRAAEVNERVNQKYREEQKAKQNQKTETKTQAAPKIESAKKPKNEEISNGEIDALIKELEENTSAIKSQLKDTNSVQRQSKPVEDYTKAVDRVNNTIKSNNISKEDSKKIADTTSKIVAEYNKKIESAKTAEEKEALVKEASQKINENLAKVSEDLVQMSKENPSLYDQKNETLVLEIEATDKENSDKNHKNTTVSKTSSVEKSPKLASEDKYDQLFKFAIAIFVVFLISLSISLAHVLRKKDKNNP